MIALFKLKAMPSDLVTINMARINILLVLS